MTPGPGPGPEDNLGGDPESPGSDLDRALADTFPASDPPSQTVPVAVTGSQYPCGHRLDLFRVVSRDQADGAFGPQPRYSARRWTSEGTPAVYASLSVAGALLEILAHTQGPAPQDLVLVIASVPETCVETARDLPSKWREHPYGPEVQAYGDRWAASERSLALKVPSAICDREFNVQINPRHADRARLNAAQPSPLTVDPRIRE